MSCSLGHYLSQEAILLTAFMQNKVKACILPGFLTIQFGAMLVIQLARWTCKGMYSRIVATQKSYQKLA